MLKGNIATACIDFGLSESSPRFALVQSVLTNIPLVVVCLAVLFMQKRDERRARASQTSISDADGTVAELADDIDTKTKLSSEDLYVH